MKIDVLGGSAHTNANSDVLRSGYSDESWSPLSKVLTILFASLMAWGLLVGAAWVLFAAL